LGTNRAPLSGHIIPFGIEIMIRGILFRLACVIVGVSPIIIWMTLDAGLPATIFYVREVLTDGKLASLCRAVLSTDTRYLLRGILAAGACGLWIGMLYLGSRASFLAGNRDGDRPWHDQRGARIAFAVFHCLALGACVFWGDFILERGLYLRAKHLSEHLIPAAQTLFESWPDKTVRITPIGRVSPHAKNAKRLWAIDTGRSAAFKEGVGYNIERDPAENLLLFLLRYSTINGRLRAIVCLRNEQIEPDQEALRIMQINWLTRKSLGNRMYLVEIDPQ
jgi:hypothetical protein